MKQSSSEYEGLTIKKCGLKDNVLTMLFDNGIGIHITDEGQDCCERRYATTDDDLSKMSGEVLKSISLKSTEEQGKIAGWDNAHDIEFLIIETDKDTYTVVNHNEHNGYYGGFSMRIKQFNQE